MAADVTNVKLGTCQVTFKGIDLGHTIGGVTFTYEQSYHETAVDKYGETIVERFLLGEKMSAVVPLAESTIANFAVAMPAGTSNGSKVTLGSKAGKRMSDEAGLLVLHPETATNTDDDIVIYKAMSTQSVEVGMMNDGERLIEVTFESFIDETKSNGNYLGLIGDSAS